MWWQSAGGSAGPGWSKRASLVSGDWYGSQLGLSSPMWFLILREASLLVENYISKTSRDLGSDISQCNIYLPFGQSKSQASWNPRVGGKDKTTLLVGGLAKSHQRHTYSGVGGYRCFQKKRISIFGTFGR